MVSSSLFPFAVATASKLYRACSVMGVGGRLCMLQAPKTIRMTASDLPSAALILV